MSRLVGIIRQALFHVGVMGLCVHSVWAQADVPNDPLADSRIVSVSLFKNGLAIIRRQIDVAEPGTYRIHPFPEPIHGTFLMQAQGQVDARTEWRRMESEQVTPLGVNLQEELQGMKVTIRGRSLKQEIEGIVLAYPQSQIRVDPFTSMSAPSATIPTSRFLLLRTANGTLYLDANEITSIEVQREPNREKMMENRPVLLLSVSAEAAGKPIQMTYLTHGLSWAPSYHVDLKDEKGMTIQQDAVVRNELSDLTESEIRLISGYPNVEYGHVLSPLAASQTWNQFFQQIAGRGGLPQAFTNSVLVQNAYSSTSQSAPTIAPNLGDTLDLHYQSIGVRTLKRGGSLALTVGRSAATYERIVQWLIPDTRDEWGNLQAQQNVDPQTGEVLQDHVWDALRFNNPFKTPMTSAPVLISSGGEFSGQSHVNWTASGEEATVRVNKALSVRARHVEFESELKGEVPGAVNREVIHVGGRNFRRAIIRGELRLCNHRGTTIKMIIRRRFSGDYLSGDGEPKLDLREEGAWMINKRNELTWNLNLEPAQEVTLTYKYQVLVPF